MGFMDKAKQMAEQAQAKLDEAQKQFHQGQQGGQQPSEAPVEYDEHGRPIPQEESAAPPHGDPLAGSSAPPPPTTPGVPPTADAPAPAAPPAQPEGDAAHEDRNHPSYAPPKLTGGDPLAG